MGDTGDVGVTTEQERSEGQKSGKQNCILFMDRGLTDWPTLLMFGAFLFGMVIVAQLAFSEGNVDRITYGNLLRRSAAGVRDGVVRAGTNWKGTVCNTDGQYKNQCDLSYPLDWGRLMIWVQIGPTHSS